MDNKIVIANMMRAKNKQSFFAIHQLYNKIKNNDPNCDVEFHILWDENYELIDNENEKWEDLINNYGFNIISYNKEFFIITRILRKDTNQSSLLIYFSINKCNKIHY